MHRQDTPAYKASSIQAREQTFLIRCNEIDANPKLSKLKKKKEKKKLYEERDKSVKDINDSMMIDETRVEEAEENLKFFLDVETRNSIDHEKANALFLTEEPEKLETAHHLNLFLYHNNFEEDHKEYKKLV